MASKGADKNAKGSEKDSETRRETRGSKASTGKADDRKAKSSEAPPKVPERGYVSEASKRLAIGS